MKWDIFFYKVCPWSNIWIFLMLSLWMDKLPSAGPVYIAVEVGSYLNMKCPITWRWWNISRHADYKINICPRSKDCLTNGDMNIPSLISRHVLKWPPRSHEISWHLESSLSLSMLRTMLFTLHVKCIASRYHTILLFRERHIFHILILALIYW